MSYVDEHLNPGEAVVHRTTLHPVIFLSGGLLVLLSLVAASLGANLANVAMAWALFMKPDPVV